MCRQSVPDEAFFVYSSKSILEQGVEGTKGKTSEKKIVVLLRFLCKRHSSVKYFLFTAVNPAAINRVWIYICVDMKRLPLKITGDSGRLATKSQCIDFANME